MGGDLLWAELVWAIGLVRRKCVKASEHRAAGCPEVSAPLVRIPVRRCVITGRQVAVVGSEAVPCSRKQLQLDTSSWAPGLRSLLGARAR